MDPVDFPGADVVVAKDQPPYKPLPVQWVGGDMGVMLMCWEMSEEELAEVIRTRRIWITSLTFSQPIQPLCVSTDRPVL